MKMIEKKVNIDATAPAGHVFIDIETTGLAKESSNIYLVGIAHYVCDTNTCSDTPAFTANVNGSASSTHTHCDTNAYWLFKQWLLESPLEEAEALEEIANYLKNFDTLVHFNGDGFDLPYLDYHARLAGVKSPYLTMKSLDIFKKIRCTKALFKLDSAKQKAFERIVGNDREDKYGGGELIKVYYEYLEAHDEEKLHALLLHNEEDVLGMTTLINLLPYGNLYDKSKKITSVPPKVVSQTEEEILLQFKANDFFKYKTTRWLDGSIYLVLDGNVINLKLPLETCEMKYFFPHPEDYFYLPKEDIAVHKSVGAAVDPNFREKATKYNCYAKKHGSFIKLESTDYARIYRYRYGTLPHALVDDELLQDVEFWNCFLFDLLGLIKKSCYLE